MNRAWRDAFAGADLPWSDMRATVDRPPEECGWSPDTVGLYCALDHTFYLDPGQLGYASAGILMTELVLHEMGHHVQALGGINDVLQLRSGSDETLIRRAELQAECLMGLGFGRLTTLLPEDERESMLERREFSEDSPRWGSAQSRLRWTKSGLAGQSAGACNTFAAPASDVT